MAKRFYDTGLPDQLWYQKLTPKCKALYMHLLCKCDVAGTFEVNLPMMTAYVGEQITEQDVFESFGNRVVPLMNALDKGIIVDFVYFQCGGVINPNVRAHQAVLRRLDELHMTVAELQSLCTHELGYVDANSSPTVEKEKAVEPKRVNASRSDDAKKIVEMFDRFYAAYPRHDSKQVSLRSFTKLMTECKSDDERNALLDKMLAAVDKSKTSDQWLKNGGQFIPMPSTWLNQKRWEDEGLVAAPTANQKKESQLASAFASALSV